MHFAWEKMKCIITFFYDFENICDILTLRDTNNQVLKHCMMKIQFATYLVDTKYCQMFSSQVLFFRYVFWHLLQLVSCPISTICVRFSVHRALLPKLKPLYSAFNTSALSITILSIVTTWHILGMDGNVCNALKTKLNLVTNFNPKIISNKFLTS